MHDEVNEDVDRGIGAQAELLFQRSTETTE
jgi:hypothetical protein